MKSLLIIFILLAPLHVSFSQSFITDSLMGIYVKNGYAAKNFVPKGKKDALNRPTGKWTEYTFQSIQFFEENDENDGVDSYLIHVLLQSKGEYDSGKKTGVWKFYVLEEKSLKKYHLADMTFVRNDIEGPVIYYFLSGEKASEGNFVRNVKTGPTSDYYKSGNVFSKYELVRDNIHGDFTSYYPTGEVKTNVNYINGKREGEQTVYYANGSIKTKWNFSSGKFNGLSQHFYPNGKIREESKYVDDEIVDYKYFYDTGQLWVQREYKDKEIFNIIELNDKNGISMDFGTLKDGNGTIIFYTQEGKVYLIRTLENGIEVKEEHFDEFE